MVQLWRICPLIASIILCDYRAIANKLPKTWITCKYSSLDLNSCLGTAIEGAVRELAAGYSPLGVLPLDPLHFDSILIDQGSGAVNIKLALSNLSVIGFKDIKVLSVKNPWKQMEVQFKLLNPLILDGHYNISGKVLILPINGDGHFKLKSDDYSAKMQLKVRELKKKEKLYYEVENLRFDFSTNRTYFHFDNLFNGNKALGDNMNRFLNINSVEVLQELKPAISKAFGEGFRDIANRVFSRVPLDLISPS